MSNVVVRRGNSGGSWLPEEKKANMWHGRGNGSGSWPPAFPRSLSAVCKVGQNYLLGGSDFYLAKNRCHHSPGHKKYINKRVSKDPVFKQ